ncbi:MAG TPA: nucleotide exchange factor GrpE [Acidimicrobiia bacterium]|jgi:molecular chaperone GrpE
MQSEEGVDTADDNPGVDAEDNGDSMQTIEAEFDSDLAALTSERDEFRAVAQRLQADFENFKKRSQREQAAVTARANERLLEELLPALDSFDLAMTSLEAGGGAAEQADLDKLTKGVSLAVGQLRDALDRAGLERMAAEGAPFDPEEHEAVMHEEGDGDPVVAGVLRAGYRLNGRVLRPAMVKVSRDSG